ncbi:MAG: tetratricopeptide repeat protein [Candidatus Electrothrix sp.]
MSQPASLSLEGEQAWLRLKQHLEWSEYFALGFIFTRHPLVVAVFRQRLADIHRARVTRLHIELPTTPEDLIQVLLPELLTPPLHAQALNAPCWLDLTRESGEEWPQARMNFLVRLNEQREKLRNARNRPLILILPETERVMVREMSPDLWTIRNFTLVTKNWLEEESALPVHPPAPQQHQSTVFSLSDYDRSLVAEWERIGQAQNHDALKVADRAYTVLLKNGSYKQAAALADEMLSISRRIIERVGETPESLRDLSVSLNKSGETSQRLGELEDAQKAYHESLEIRRKIIERVGETPESLRDLSVSLDNVGNTSQRLGELEDAQKAYHESLEISRKIIERVGETPESLRDLSVSLYKSGQLSDETGNKEAAHRLFQEGLHIAEALAKILPDQVDYNELPGYFLKKLATLKE